MTRDLMYSEEIHELVRDAYTGLESPNGAALRFYTDGELEALPEGARRWALGVGNPVRHAGLDEGEDVVDLGCGSGVAGLAAARAGARRVLAVDVDPLARAAARQNAAHNGLVIETAAAAPATWDLLLAADVLYETGLRDWVLGEGRRRGRILLADPGRAGTPSVALRRERTLAARTFPDVDAPQTRVTLFVLERVV